eukprot:TRINITY_DN44202_c0_g1_i1.p1 TRINITY_DN44202_c0_g1~~TRINITY_DN44202_c0_g1_i1.p1  ORF type:complete len:340 (+),score=32.88 TRINITY_DN44202_c0_g1_i1:205-1224(+)
MIQQMLLVQPNRGFDLIGCGMGALLVYEMSIQLGDAGRAPQLGAVVLVDPPLPENQTKVRFWKSVLGKVTKEGMPNTKVLTPSPVDQPLPLGDVIRVLSYHRRLVSEHTPRESTASISLLWSTPRPFGQLLTESHYWHSVAPNSKAVCTLGSAPGRLGASLKEILVQSLTQGAVSQEIQTSQGAAKVGAVVTGPPCAGPLNKQRWMCSLCQSASQNPSRADGLGCGGAKQTWYRIWVHVSQRTDDPGQAETGWYVERRYSHFQALAQVMAGLHGGLLPENLPSFPPKHWYGNKTKEVVSARMELINRFFQSLTQEQFSHHLIRMFLSFPDTGLPKSKLF